MRSTPTVSSASGDLPAGTVVAGFRVERLIGRGSRATVYEATQLSLERRVALKLLDDHALADHVQRLSWPEHPGAVSLFGSGDSEHGPWLAMRLVRGATLATRTAPLEPVAAALAQAHAAGLVHGDISTRNVLIEEGRAYLSDFGLVPGGSVEADRAALAELVERQADQRSRRRRGLGLAGVGVAATVVLGAVLAARGDDGSARLPPAPVGTEAIGSRLAEGDVESVDCNGRPPTGASPACTITQRELAGAPVVVPLAGTITSWAVRGAQGTLALQVLRRRGRGLVEADQSRAEDVPGPELHVVRSRLAVAAGDRVALEVSPGAAVGVRRAGPRTSTERWFGPLLEPARAPERPAGTGLDRELLLRVDVRPGEPTGALSPVRGERAARLPAGRRLATRRLSERRSVAAVALGGALVLDLFEGSRRLARTPVAEADGRGRLVTLTPTSAGARVRWVNPSNAQVDRTVPLSR